MTLSTSWNFEARDEFADHLRQFDWSHLTPGRRHILDAFLTLATTKGYSAVTMRALGTAINVKAPSIYSHFPNGRDEIVNEALRWHYYSFGTSLLDELHSIEDPWATWDAMVRNHFQRQMTQPENDLWDLLIASDRVGRFLQEDIRQEVHYWLDLCVRMYEQVAIALGFQDCKMKAHVVMKLLDTATSWSLWDKTNDDLELWTGRAISLTHAILENPGDASKKQGKPAARQTKKQPAQSRKAKELCG